MQQDIKIIEELHGGFVKQMFLVSWKGMKLVYSLPRDGMYQEDFQHGVKMMEGFQGIRFFAQLVGFCYEPLQVLMPDKLRRFTSRIGLRLGAKT